MKVNTNRPSNGSGLIQKREDSVLIPVELLNEKPDGQARRHSECPELGRARARRPYDWHPN
eukprot:10507011-Heterocapsa_arctica.AAC.1